jgi:hypothetical protein
MMSIPLIATIGWMPRALPYSVTRRIFPAFGCPVRVAEPAWDQLAGLGEGDGVVLPLTEARARVDDISASSGHDVCSFVGLLPSP